MKKSDLFKVVPVAAIALSVYSTSVLAGATNRDENTAATPGEKATTTTTPADPAATSEDVRSGQSSSDMDAGGSGSAGGTGSTGSDVDPNSYSTPNSSADPGAGSAPENADSGYDASTGNTSGSSTGTKDSDM
ncbi:MAG TPA: hypothetical protein VFF75_09025 [Methylophilaceae bacterium]|nr:hypothetical protein [Methylophilaceae bacterium]